VIAFFGLDLYKGYRLFAQAYRQLFSRTPLFPLLPSAEECRPLFARLDPDTAARRVENFFRSTQAALATYLRVLGLDSVSELGSEHVAAVA